MICLVAGALIFTSLAFMFFTRQEVTQSMLALGKESARNVLQVVKLNIESEYKDLGFFQHYSLKRYELQLQNLINIVIDNIEFFHELSKRRILTEEQAKKLALEMVQTLRYGKNDYFYIFNRAHVAISHPDPNMLGQSLYHIDPDVLGQAISSPDAKMLGLDTYSRKAADGAWLTRTMFEEIDRDGEGFTKVYWLRLEETEPALKLLYYRHYPEWDWLVGTGVYIDDIEVDIQKKIAAIMVKLKKTFAKIKVAETGYIFVFNDERKILIHPSLAGMDGSDLKDPETGENHFDNLIKASQTPDIAYRYLWDKPSFPGQYKFYKSLHIEHFVPFDWYISSSVYEDELQKPAKAILSRQMVFVGLLVVFCVLITYLLVSLVTKPLAKLTRYAGELQENNFSMPEQSTGVLRSITFPSEVGRLARTIESMEQRLKEYLKDLMDTTAAKQSIESELQIAHDIQMSMLAKGLPKGDFHTSVDIAAILKPARNVGGDLYDYFFINDDLLYLVVGDVSDKGVPAALFMARSIALLRAVAADCSAPDVVFERINEELKRGNEICMFLTAFLGILNVKTGEFIFSNAGHVPPIILSASGGCTKLDLPPGKPLGLPGISRYGTGRLIFKQGDMLFLYTDGITEAGDRNGRMFSDERLEKLLEQCYSDKSDDIVKKINAEVNSFCSGTQQGDDITMLVVRVVDLAKSRMIEKITINNDLSQIEVAAEILERFGSENSIPNDIVFDLKLALDEVLCNIINHSFDRDIKSRIEVEMSFTRPVVSVTISDEGRSYNPLKNEPIDPAKLRAEKKIGGLGLHLVNKLMDELHYSRVDNKNVFTMKKFDPAQTPVGQVTKKEHDLEDC